jgi:Ni,Fe-hydrogenase I large subunit
LAVALANAPRLFPGGPSLCQISRPGHDIHYIPLVVPTTWNASPRDAKGQSGAYEASLVGTPLAVPDQPLEILRTIHSFDPCMACAIHMVDARGKPLTEVSSVPGLLSCSV